MKNIRNSGRTKKQNKNPQSEIVDIQSDEQVTWAESEKTHMIKRIEELNIINRYKNIISRFELIK